MKTKREKFGKKSTEQHVGDRKIKKKKKTQLGPAEKNKIKSIIQNTVLKKNNLISRKTNNQKKKIKTEDKISNTKTRRQISGKKISNNNKPKENIVESPTNQNNKQRRKSEKRRLKRKQQKAEKRQNISENNGMDKLLINPQQKKRKTLKEKLQQTLNAENPFTNPKSKPPPKSLRARMLEKLQAARFRYINEQIYSSDSKETQKLFSNDPESFHAYHEGYRQQLNKWPLNPVDVVIKSIQQMPQTHIVADFGCGEASLAKSVKQKVHSFDLVAKNENVTVCDMARVPLPKASVDVAVFCLSLMGTNLKDYLLEANRVLKEGGVLKVAEVESRFEDINQFIQALKKFHFKLTWKDLSHNLFYFLDFKKEANIKNKKKLPTLSLNPCLYKKR